MQHRWGRLDTAALLAWAALTLAVRASFAPDGSYSVDGALLSLGVSSFDFSDYRPHAPYYPLTIAVGKLLARLLGPTHALTALTVLASGALTAFVFAIGHRLGGRFVAQGCAALVVASPLLLLNGAVPLTYMVEGAAATAVAWTALRARSSPTRPWMVLLGLGAAATVGLRPSALLLVAPVILWAARTWRQRWTIAGAGLFGVLLWLPATIVAGGSWRDFQDGIDLQSRAFILSNPVWLGGTTAVMEHAQWLVWHARFEGPFLVAVATLAAITAFALRDGPLRKAASFLLAWGTPAVAFYVLVYSGWPVYPSGYLVGALTCGLVAASLALHGIARAVLRPEIAGPAKMVGVVVLVGVLALPLAWPLHWNETTRSIRAADAWEASMEGLEEAFPANTTAFLAFDAAAWAYRNHPTHWAWYVQAVPNAEGSVRLQVQENRFGQLDKGVVTNALDGDDDPQHPIPAWVTHIVLIEGQPGYEFVPLLRPDVPVEERLLPGGRAVRFFSVGPATTVESLLADWGRDLGKPHPGFSPPASGPTDVVD